MLKVVIGILSLIALSVGEEDSNRHSRQTFDQLSESGLNDNPLVNRLVNPLEGSYTVWGGNPTSQLQSNPFESVINPPYQELGLGQDLDLSDISQDLYNPFQGLLTQPQLPPTIENSWNVIPQQPQFEIQRTQQLNLQQLLAQQDNQRKLQQQLNPWLLRQQQPNPVVWQTQQINPILNRQQQPNPWVLRTQQQRPLLLQHQQPRIQIQRPQVIPTLLRQRQPSPLLWQQQQINPTIYRQQQPVLLRQQPLIRPQATVRPITLPRQQIPAFRIPQPSPISPQTYHVQPNINSHYRIIEQQSDSQPKHYQFGFSTENKIQAAEEGVVDPNDNDPHNNDQAGSRVRGFYEYVGDDGETYHVDYTADENGYRPTGKHIVSVNSAPAEAVSYRARGPQAQGLRYALPYSTAVPQLPTSIPYAISSIQPQLSGARYTQAPASQIPPLSYTTFPTLQPSPSPLIYREGSSSISPYVSFNGQPSSTPTPTVYQSTFSPLQLQK